MGRRWFKFVAVAPELLRDPVALGELLRDASYLAPEGAMSPQINRIAVSCRDQVDGSEDTVIRVFGSADGSTPQG